jgi:hypothetical protein
VFLDVLRDPPIVVLLKVANRNTFGTRGNSKFCFVWRPLYRSGCTVDPEDYEGRLPNTTVILPHICITVLRASYQSVCGMSPVDASNSVVMFRKNNFLHKLSGAGTFVNVHLVTVVGAESHF